MTEKFTPIGAGDRRRRSPRIEQSVPLVVSWPDSSGAVCREETFTSSINCYGCTYFSRFPIHKNAKIAVQLKPLGALSTNAKKCFPARVAWIQKSPLHADLYQVGVEFDPDPSSSSLPDQEDAFSLLTEIERLLQFARVGTHYQLLGLQPDTPRSEIKRRFYRLARRFHPDFHMDHPEWTPRLLLLMDSLTIAYKTLWNDGAKRSYDSRAAARGLGQERADTQHLTQECLVNAQACVAAKNYVGSILWLRRVIESKPQSSRYRAMLGRSLAAVPEYRHEAVEQYEKAIQLDSLNIAAHFQYAQLLEQMKFPLRARPHYVRVMELDPHHLQARERLNKLDVASPRSVLGASLLSRLTGRRSQ